MGLRKSEHISKIIVHPENSDVIWVASQGPLWSPVVRGDYIRLMTEEKLEKVLGGGEWTGVQIYLLTQETLTDCIHWQRHRTVAALMGGGPESAFTDPKTAVRHGLNKSGLPGSNKGKLELQFHPKNQT